MPLGAKYSGNVGLKGRYKNVHATSPCQNIDKAEQAYTKETVFIEICISLRGLYEVYARLHRNLNVIQIKLHQKGGGGGRRRERIYVSSMRPVREIRI